MNRGAHLLLKTQNTAFRSAATQAYSTARTDLKRGIKRVKHCLQVEDPFSNPDTCGRASVSSVNTSPPTPLQLPLTHPSSTSLTTSVGYPWPAIQALLAADHQRLSFSTTDVEAVLSQINVHNSASPDGIPGRVHRASTGELAGSWHTYSTCLWPMLLFWPASNPLLSCQ